MLKADGECLEHGMGRVAIQGRVPGRLVTRYQGFVKYKIPITDSYLRIGMYFSLSCAKIS